MARKLFIFVLLLIPASLRAADESKPPITAILGAMSLETELLQKSLTPCETITIEKHTFYKGKLAGRDVVVTFSGIGKVNAAVTTTLVLEHFKPAEVLFTGIAGGINPDMQTGDVLIATQSAQHDYGDITDAGMKHEGIRNPATGKRAPLFLPGDPRLIKLAEDVAGQIKLRPIAMAQGERTPKIVKGTVVTGDVFVATSQKKAELRKDMQADAVEMEGGAVAQVCHQQDVPCLIIRSLSDLADANAPKDFQIFARTAAENSAKFVTDIVSLIAKLGAPAGK
jgi:adenosylhomocysteine nucleosidase